MVKPLVYGIGINDTNSPTYREEIVDGKRKVVWRCPYYRKWTHMLERAYSRKFKAHRPTYEGVTVCDEWLTFSNFKSWMESQDWEGKQLDKDFLVEGNREYSPSSCLFISQRLNSFIITGEKSRGDWPLGVHFYKRANKWASGCKDGNDKSIHLGYYQTPHAAHIAWMRCKLRLMEELMEKERCGRTRSGLMRLMSKLEFHIENDIELKSF